MRGNKQTLSGSSHSEMMRMNTASKAQIVGDLVCSRSHRLDERFRFGNEYDRHD